MRISDWSSDVCASDLAQHRLDVQRGAERGAEQAHAAVALGARAVADVVQVARRQVAVGVRRTLFEPRTDPARVLAGLAKARGLRPEALRFGNEVVSSFRSRWSPFPNKKKKTHI